MIGGIQNPVESGDLIRGIPESKNFLKKFDDYRAGNHFENSDKLERSDCIVSGTGKCEGLSRTGRHVTHHLQGWGAPRKFTNRG